MDDKDATLRGKLEDLFSDLNESIQAEASPAALPKGIPERAPGAEHQPTGQPLVALRTLAEHTTDAILLSDLAGRVTFSNRACCDLLGYDYTPNEMVGLESTVLWPDEERVRLTGETPSGVPQALTREWRGEVVQRRKDGSLLKASLTLFPVRDEQEQSIAVAFILRDLTEHKQAEEPLTQERSLLRTLIDNLPDYIYVKDSQSRFVVVNQAQVRLLGGATPEELLGKSDLDFFPHELAQKYYTDEQAILQSGQPLINLEEPTVDAAGNKKWTATTKVPLRDSHGQVTGFVGVGRDITERKQAEAERERLMATLARRAVQLQTSAEVSRAASILNLDELLPQTVGLIRDRFDLYYTGIFLADETGQSPGHPSGVWAVLRAGTGQAGHKMLEANHRLQIGGSSMIGWCIANRQARIALDVGEEAVRFDNPLLPETRSEMALPLISRGHAIGAITIQSSQPAAFTPEDITVLQTMADQVANAIENARLFEEARTSAEKLAVLNQVSQKLVSILDVDQVLITLLDDVPHLLPRVSASVWLTDPATGNLVCQRAVGIQSDVLRGQQVAPGEGLSGWVVAHGKSVSVPDAKADERHFAGVDQQSGLTVRSFLSVPLKVRNEVIGVLNAADATVNRFSMTDQTLLELLAASGAIAISNAFLFEQTSAAQQQAEARVHEMQILQKVIQAASSTLDLEHVIDALFDALSREMGFTFIAFNLIDEPANVMRTVRAVGLARGNDGLVRPLGQMQNDILTDVARKRQIEVIDGWDDRLDRAIFEREGHTALVRAFVPLLLQEKPIGILEVGYLRQERPVITPEEVRLLGSLADQLAVTIQNARLFEESQRRAAREQMLSTMTARIRAGLTLEQVLNATVQEIGTALGAARVAVRLKPTRGDGRKNGEVLL
jgi:PAS domain S-box-containing protein